WLKPEYIKAETNHAAIQRIEAALNFSAGQSYWRWWSRPTPPDYLPVLANLLAFAWDGGDDLLWVVERLSNANHFISSLPARKVAKRAFAEVRTNAMEMSVRKLGVGLRLAD